MGSRTGLRRTWVGPTDDALVGIRNYVRNTGIEVTIDTLNQALESLRPHLKFYSPVVREYRNLTASITEQDRDLILAMISSRGLKDQGEDQLSNFNTIASYMIQMGLPFDAANIDNALGRITSAGRRPLTWKPRLQPGDALREKERQEREAEAAKHQPKQHSDYDDIPSYVTWNRRDDWVANMRAMEAAKVKKAEPQTGTDDMFKSMAENVTTRSNLENASIKKLFVMKPETSDIDWKATYRQRQIAAERYNTRSSMAGR